MQPARPLSFTPDAGSVSLFTLHPSSASGSVATVADRADPRPPPSSPPSAPLPSPFFFPGRCPSPPPSSPGRIRPSLSRIRPVAAAVAVVAGGGAWWWRRPSPPPSSPPPVPLPSPFFFPGGCPSPPLLYRSDGEPGIREMGSRRALTDIKNLVEVAPYPCAVAKKPMLQKRRDEKKTALPSSRPMTRKFAASLASKEHPEWHR
ncbi:uncharacterized protein [Miscanthus floridulus]|uniref:uncharacterized protein n=1 Tax=Miscanthus floridulus TaxID=154761 RepID=UPI0034591F1E